MRGYRRRPDDGQIVHAGPQLKMVCTAATRLPAYLILPDRLLPAFSALFESVPLRQFHVDASAHTVAPLPWTVHVLQVRGLHPALVERCREALERR